MPVPEFVDDLLAAQADAAKDIEKDFLKSVKVTIQNTDWEQLERDLSSYADGDKVINGVAWEDFDPKERLKDLFSACLDIDGEYIGKVAGGAKFDYVDPRALERIEKYGADDVVDIDASTKQAIRSIVREGYETGITPRNQARQIRALVGLDERRAETLRKYSENLFSKGRSEARVWALVEKRGRVLLNARSLTIAVNETSEASAQAGYWSTKSACARGVLDPNEYEGYRIITPDERLCTRCSGISGEARQIPDGTYESTGSNTAKVHTCCRCCEGLRRMKKKQTVKRATGQGRMNIVFDCQALKRKEGILYVPTVPLVEGVYEQWGFRVFRSYAEFSQSSHWLHGIPVVVNHEEVTPEARRIGQLFDVQNKPDGLKATAISRFYEIDCTQRELEALLSGQPHDGSLRWSCFLEESPGEWTDPATGERKQYDYKEVGPYTFVEYSFVKQGVIGTNDGAGFNMQCKSCNSNHPAPGGADMEIEEMKQAIEEALSPLKGQIATLEQSNKTLQDELKSIKEQAETDKKAQVFESFQTKLKPGHQEKAKELFAAYQADPAKWVLENADKFIQARQERKLQGSAITEGGQGGFDLEAERAKLKAEGKVI
jgi:DNA-binding transcriptional MerR regulator